MSEISQADIFPLIRGGGIFLVAAGVSMLLGSITFRLRYPLFTIGAAMGGALTAFYAAPLAAPFGPPTMLQIASLAGAVLLEVMVLGAALRHMTDERLSMLVILAIVGGHFVLMAPAFGPIVVMLAGLTLLNVLAALLGQSYSSVSVWAIDGFLKAVAGGAMYLGHVIPYTAFHW